MSFTCESCHAKTGPKFSQNPDAKALLLSTGTREIAEASPHDKSYGIGIALHDTRRHDMNNWGTNIMGETLKEVRDELKVA